MTNHHAWRRSRVSCVLNVRDQCPDGYSFRGRLQNKDRQQCPSFSWSGGGGWGVLDIMHGCSRMTIDPRIPTMPGRGARRVFIDQADVACTRHEAPRGVWRVAWGSNASSCCIGEVPPFWIDRRSPFPAAMYVVPHGTPAMKGSQMVTCYVIGRGDREGLLFIAHQ